MLLSKRIAKLEKKLAVLKEKLTEKNKVVDAKLATKKEAKKAAPKKKVVKAVEEKKVENTNVKIG